MCAEFKDLASLMGQEQTGEKAAATATKKGSGTSLLKDYVISDKYKILSVLSDKKNRATYLVKDIKITDKKYIIREIKPESTDQVELKDRREKFRQIIRILSTFKHKNLMEVYDSFTENNREYAVMEYVEGLDLKKLTKMAASYPPFHEEKAIKWGLELCDAIEFMHERPQPFTLGDFVPSKIMVDADGNLNIISYDLQRFFDVNRTLEFMPDDPKKLYEDITKLAQVLYFMITGRKFDDDDQDPEFPEEISPKFKKLLETACHTGQMSIGSIIEFRKKLEDALVPETDIVEEQKKRIWPTLTIKIDPIAVGKDLWYRFTSQNPLIIGLEIVFVVFLLLYGNLNREKPYQRPPNTDLAYVICGGDLYTLNSEKGEKLGMREPLNQEILNFTATGMLTQKVRIPKGLSPNKNQSPQTERITKEVILISDGGRSIIDILDPDTNKIIGYISTETGPGAMVPDDENRFLYVLHSKEAGVSVIDLNDLHLKNLFSTSINPVSMAYIPLTSEEKEILNKLSEERKNAVAETEVAEEDKSEAGKTDPPSSTLAVSCSESRKILFLNAKTGRQKISVNIAGKPGKLVLSLDNKMLYCLDMEKNKLLKVDVADGKYEEIDMMFPGAVDMEMDPETGILWIVHTKSNQVVPFDTNTGKFGKALYVNNQPLSISYNNQKNLWILNRGSKGIVIIDSKGAILDRISLDRVPVLIDFLNKEKQTE